VYRTFDGKCNNKVNKTWGSAFTTQPRFLDENYADSGKFTSGAGTAYPSGAPEFTPGF